MSRRLGKTNTALITRSSRCPRTSIALDMVISGVNLGVLQAQTWTDAIG